MNTFLSFNQMLQSPSVDNFDDLFFFFFPLGPVSEENVPTGANFVPRLTPAENHCT